MSEKPVIVTFKLFAGRDDDLIEWLKSLGSREKSSYIRLAIRQQFITGPGFNGFAPSLPGPTLPTGQAGGNGHQTPAVLSDVDLEARLDRW
jgi:hypothetical protein